MKNTAGRAIQNTNLFYDYVFLFLSGFGNEFQNLQVWSCNITWQSRLFVCLAALVFFFPLVKRDSGALGTWLCEGPRMGHFSYLFL